MDEPMPIPGKPYIESEIVEFIEQHDRWDTDIKTLRILYMWLFVCFQHFRLGFSERTKTYYYSSKVHVCVCGFICSIM